MAAAVLPGLLVFGEEVVSLEALLDIDPIELGRCDSFSLCSGLQLLKHLDWQPSGPDLEGLIHLRRNTKVSPVYQVRNTRRNTINVIRVIRLLILGVSRNTK